MSHSDNKDAQCCPNFDPSPWDEKTHVWQDKLFIKDSVPQLFHMPLPYMVGKKITHMWKLAKKHEAEPELKDFLMLATDPSPWKSYFYMHVTKEIPEADNVKLSGTFLTKVFDGPFKDIRKWIKEMDKYVESQNKKLKKYYVYYTTCPKCAKKYGHNYVVFFAEVE